MRLAVKETETKNLLETLANKSPVGLYIVQDGRFCYTNPTFQSTTGYTEDELVGRDALDFVVPEDKERVRENAIKMLKGGLALPYQFRVTHKNGSIKWIMESVVSVQYLRRRATLGDFIDITERKQVEEKVQHLNLVLQAIRNINQLIARGTDRNSLLKCACDTFVKARGYYSAWIALLDESGKLVIAAEAGLGKSFLQVMEMLKRGELTHCGCKVLEKPGVLVMKDISSECEDCPVAKEDTGRGAMSVRLEYGGKVYGLMTVYIPPGRGAEKEEYDLLEEIAGDIAFALHSMEQEQERKQAEEELQETEAEKSALLEGAPVAILNADLKGKITYVNKRFESESGYSREEIVGKNGLKLDWLPAGTIRYLTQRMAVRLRGGPSKYWETQLKCKDGRWIWIEIEGKVLRKSGVPVGFQIIARNITERKQAEEALQAEKNKLQSLVDALEDGLTIQDRDYNIIYEGRVQRSIVGEHLGEKCYRIYAGREKVCEGCPVEKAFKDGKSHTAERRMVEPSGEISFWENTANPIRDASGEIVSCLEINRNITERKKQEQALADEATRRRVLVDQSLDGIVVLDQDARVCEANPRFAEMLGYTLEEVYKLHTWDWDKNFPPEQIMEMGRNVDEKGLHLETKHTRKDGSVIDVDISINGTMFGGQKLIFCVCRDITKRNRAEEALKNSEESYRELADSITEVFFAMDEHLRYTYWNKASEILTGVRAKDALGKSLHDIFPDTPGLKRAEKVYRAVLRTRKSRTFINDFDIDGRHYIFEIGAYPSKGGISVFVRDITKRKQAEEALLQSEENYRALFESTVIGTIVIEAETMKVMIANQAAAEMLGFSSAEEITGVNPLDFVLPENRERVRELLVKEFFKQDLRQTHELRMITKDGRQIWISANGARIVHEGRLAGLASFTDITQHKKMEEAIRHAAEEWRKTFDSITDAISIHDRNFQIQRANKAFADIFDMKPSQIIGRHCYELHKGQKPKSGCPHKQTLATKQPAVAEFYESHLGKYLHESTSPILDEKGEVVGTVHITRDISEQKQQNERLMMADRLASIGELAAGTAHELNNPLTSIIGFSQLLMEKDIPDEAREDVELIYNEAQRAANVTKSLLTFGRKHSPVKQPNQINNIIEDVLKLRTYEHNVNGVKVKKLFAPDLPEIMVDYFQMQQVFLNIIINAEYFITEARKRGKLTITTKKQNNNVRISFADDGPGISRENMNRVFNPFFTTKEAGRGTGLGLSICHGIVSEHGGQIYARSQPGKGATIIVELPINNL